MTGLGSRALPVAVAASLALAAAFERLGASEGAPAIAWRAPVTVATGNAFRGPWRMNESAFDFVDDPTVALMPDGDAAVAWVDQARKDIRFQRYGPDGRQRLMLPVEVSRTPGVFSWLPRLAVDADHPENVYALWQEIVFSGGSHGGEIYFARSTDGGHSFGEPINLSRSPAGDGKGRLTRNYWHNGSLDLAVGPDGTLYAAWTEYEGPLYLARSSDGGETFSEPRRIAGGPGRLPGRGPALAAGKDGIVHLAWTVGGDRHADIRHARSTDGGVTFGEPVRVGAGPGHADAPKLALDAEGTLHLAYAVSASGPVGRYAIRYTRATGTDGFEAPRTISAPLPQGFASAAFPHLATPAHGRVYVVCELFRERPGRRPRGLAIMRSDDGGDRFVPPAVIPGTARAGAGINGSQQGLLMRKLDAAPGGRIAVVNSKFRRGEASHVRLYLSDVP